MGVDVALACKIDLLFFSCFTFKYLNISVYIFLS